MYSDSFLNKHLISKKMAIDKLDIMRKHSRDTPTALEAHLRRVNKKIELKDHCIYEQLRLPKRITQCYLAVALIAFVSLGYQACDHLTKSEPRDQGVPAAGVQYSLEKQPYTLSKD